MTSSTNPDPVTEACASGPALVVDRDARAAAATAVHLCAYGYRPVHHVTDVHAVRKLARSSLSVVVFDLGCGDERRALELVGTLASHRDVPRVLVTCGSRDGKRIARALRLGAHAYLEYPVSPADLRENLNVLDTPRDCVRRLARLIVGRVGVLQALSMLRGEMVKLGMERENNSRRAAAKLLQVDRKMIQRVMAQSAGGEAGGEVAAHLQRAPNSSRSPVSNH